MNEEVTIIETNNQRPHDTHQSAVFEYDGATIFPVGNMFMGETGIPGEQSDIAIVLYSPGSFGASHIISVDNARNLAKSINEVCDRIASQSSTSGAVQ